VKKLILDFGNTLQKTAVFINGELESILSYKGISGKDVEKIIEDHGHFGACILSSVIPVDERIMGTLAELPGFMELDHPTPLPVENLYHTPETLGKDRLAGVIGANARYPGRNILVIDAGTAITFDFINSEKEYLGGAISPGIDLRFKALNEFTGRLPLIGRKIPKDLIGQSTEESILSGVMNGILAETDNIIHSYRLKYPDLLVIVTGGDGPYFVNKLKSNIFALPNLVLEGLNVILDWNVHGEKNYN